MNQSTSKGHPPYSWQCWTNYITWLTSYKSIYNLWIKNKDYQIHKNKYKIYIGQKHEMTTKETSAL